MFRKFIAFFTIIIMVLSLMSAAYAGAAYRAGNEAVFQLLDDKDGTKTFESQLILSGKSKEGTVITVSHYWYEIGQSESILKKDTNKDADENGEWVPVGDPESWTIGASGIFTKTFDLKVGQNKIVMTGKDKDGNKKAETIVVELTNKDALKDYINNLFLKDININQK